MAGAGASHPRRSPGTKVVVIVVILRGLATLQAGLGVALFFEQLLELLLVLSGGAKPYLFVVAAANGSADGDVQVVSSQPHYDLQHGLRNAAQFGRNPG